MTYLKCGTHGRQRETFVCKHIIETVADAEPRGFWWSMEDGTFEAICTHCNNLDAEAFARQAEENARILCYGCFRQAAQINGIVLDESF